MEHINDLLLNNNNQIRIISGEGETGTVERYDGKRTIKAIKLLLAKERQYGDRWAKAVIYSHINDYGPVGVDIITGDYANFPDLT
jgi:hypothetical protein